MQERKVKIGKYMRFLHDLKQMEAGWEDLCRHFEGEIWYFEFGT
jgi:hypothetical protein